MNCTCCGKQLDVSGCVLDFNESTPVKNDQGEIKAYTTEDGLVCEVCQIKLESYCCINGQSGFGRISFLITIVLLGLFVGFMASKSLDFEKIKLELEVDNCELSSIVPKFGEKPSKVECYFLEDFETGEYYYTCQCDDYKHKYVYKKTNEELDIYDISMVEEGKNE
jgi:hypothetical protein